MPRTPSSERLDAVAGAATRVFGRLGYRRTRTADVAAEAGISTGGLFTYVDSKEALFHLVFLAGFGELDDARDALPLRAPDFADTLKLIGRGLVANMGTPALATAARDDEPADVCAELAAIIEEHFRAQSRIWPVLAVIERSAADLPPLEAMYFGRGRSSRVELLERYVSGRIASGHFRAGLDAPVAARWLLETVTWFAWHRREDRDAARYDDDRVLATITAIACNALVATAS